MRVSIAKAKSGFSKMIKQAQKEPVIEPLVGWGDVEVRGHRRSEDWAIAMKEFSFTQRYTHLTIEDLKEEMERTGL